MNAPSATLFGSLAPATTNAPTMYTNPYSADDPRYFDWMNPPQTAQESAPTNPWAQYSVPSQPQQSYSPWGQQPYTPWGQQQQSYNPWGQQQQAYNPMMNYLAMMLQRAYGMR